MDEIRKEVGLGFQKRLMPLSRVLLGNFALIPLAVMLAWAGCSRETGLTVENRSSGVLTNVVVSGSGFFERIESLPAGLKQRVTVRSRGETGVRVAFDAGNRHVDAEEQGYFEGGGVYRVAVIIEPDLTVTVSSELEKY